MSWYSCLISPCCKPTVSAEQNKPLIDPKSKEKKTTGKSPRSSSRVGEAAYAVISPTSPPPRTRSFDQHAYDRLSESPTEDPSQSFRTGHGSEGKEQEQIARLQGQVERLTNLTTSMGAENQELQRKLIEANSGKRRVPESPSTKTRPTSPSSPSTNTKPLFRETEEQKKLEKVNEELHQTNIELRESLTVEITKTSSLKLLVQNEKAKNTDLEKKLAQMTERATEAEAGLEKAQQVLRQRRNSKIEIDKERKLLEKKEKELEKTEESLKEETESIKQLKAACERQRELAQKYLKERDQAIGEKNQAILERNEAQERLREAQEEKQPVHILKSQSAPFLTEV